MECEWLILCSAVERAPKGGDSLVGILGRTMADEMPITVDPLVAAFRLRGEPGERFEVNIEVVAPDGPLMGTPTIAHRIPPVGAWDSHLTLSPLTLRSFGRYSVTLRVNRRVLKTTLLLIEQFVH